MTSTQPRIKSGRFTAFGHSAPAFGLPAHRYPSEQPFRRDLVQPWKPLRMFSRRHETPVRDALEAAGCTDLHELKTDARELAETITAIQARLQHSR